MTEVAQGFGSAVAAVIPAAGASSGKVWSTQLGEAVGNSGTNRG